MNMLANLAMDESIQSAGDFLGGFRVLESGVYDFTVETAYLTQADSGATALNVELKTSDGAQVRQQFWMTSGTKKGGHNYYTDKKSMIPPTVRSKSV